MKTLLLNCIALVFVLAIVSCTNDSFDESISLPEKDALQTLLIEKGTTPITAEQAVNVALLFDLSRNPYSTKSTSSISDVFPVYNEEGMPVFFAVNRSNDAGFIIVSASRKYCPILAHVEKGHFDADYSRYGLSIWVQKQISSITTIEQTNEADSAAVLWSLYEAKDSIPYIKTKTEAEAFALRQASVAAWEAQGYTCYALMDCPSNLPSSTYSAWCSSASGLAHPDYDYMLYSVILERRMDDTTSIGPLMGSTWQQDNGYNNAVPYYYPNGDHLDLGCVAVAVGQIMRYHEKPSYYSWQSMPLNTPSTASANYLYTLGCAIGIDYASGSSGASDTQAKNTLTNTYNYTASYGYYSFQTVKSNILYGKPVYIGGLDYSNSGATLSHAWVCEGYRNIRSYYEYELRVLSVVEPLQYEYLDSTQSGTISFPEYLYFNMGFGGALDGWYYASNTCTSFTNLEGEYYNEKMIYNITPPIN